MKSNFNSSVEIPKIKETDVKAGDIFIGHHLLIAPALLLEKKLQLDETNLAGPKIMSNLIQIPLGDHYEDYT